MGTPLKLVLTGGPCSGKTSARAILLQALVKFGIWPLFVPETATTFLDSGLNSSGVFADSQKYALFQRSMFKHQLAMEASFMRLAELQQNPLLICDRGVLDQQAYMDEADFNLMLAENSMGLSDVISNYHGAVHLVTAADGAEAFFNYDNPARRETPEQARKLDKALQWAWSQHPGFRIVANKDVKGRQLTFDQKMDWLVRTVCDLMGIPAPIENERKFLLSLDAYAGHWPFQVKPIHISQTYLLSADKNVERRVRQWRYSPKDALYFYTEKRPRGDSGRSRYEDERQITANEYIALLNERDGKRMEIVKKRLCFPYDNRYYEFDLVSSPQKLCLLEVQASEAETEIDIPDFLRPYLIREVTEDPNFKMANVAAGLCPGYRVTA